MMSGKMVVLAALACVAFGTAAYAGDRSFKIDPGSVLSPGYQRPVPHRYEPPAPPNPPLTAFDRNMVPAGVRRSKAGVDLAEPLSFDKPQPKRRPSPLY
jgi:hypothetical protein